MKSKTIESKAKLNEIITTYTTRKNGTLRIQHDFSNCPTMAEQHTAHLSDINYLMSKYKPDELAAYIAARSQHRQEILNHDFASEPNLQDAKNVIYQSKQAFEALPEEIRQNFRNHLEFLKFIDNPANKAKFIKLGLATEQQLENIIIPDKTNPGPPTINDESNDEKTKKAKN